MSVNPYPLTPRDRGGEPMYDLPAAKKALVTYASENAATSSVISVSHDTTAIEITTVGGPAVLRWVATSDGAASVVSAAAGANFDHGVANSWTRRFAIPIEGPIFTAVSSMVGMNRQNSLYQRVAIKSVGNASVWLTEY